VIVLDASVVVDLLLDSPGSADKIRKRIRAERNGLAAPQLLDAEVGQVLRRFVLASRLSDVRAQQAIEDLTALPIRRYPLLPMLSRAFALRANATVYDALYIVLAEGLDARLLTRDVALAALPGHRARVEVV